MHFKKRFWKYPREKTVRADNPWKTCEMRDERRRCRKLERRKKKTGLLKDEKTYTKAIRRKAELITELKTAHLQAKVADSMGKRFLFTIVDTFLLKKSPTKLPSHVCKKELVQRFNDFFISKVVNIRSGIDAIPRGHVFVDKSADGIERHIYSHFSPVAVDTLASLSSLSQQRSWNGSASAAPDLHA